jgi:4-amino-4-deoxy-L-arabinose transferase-like glycosyltransferase
VSPETPHDLRTVPDGGPPCAGPARWRLWVVGAVVAAVYLAGVPVQWWPTPDSALYLGLGRSLAEGEGYRFNDEVCTTVTPGLPWILAGIRTVFGGGCVAPTVFIVLCALGALALMYRWLARLEGGGVALAVVLATAFTAGLYHNAHRILTDVPFVVIFWGILVALWRFRTGSAGWLVLAGLLTAAGVTLRAPGMVLLAPLGVGAVLDRLPTTSRKKAWVGGATVLLTTVLLTLAFYVIAQHLAETPPYYLSSTSGNRQADATTYFLLPFETAKCLTVAVAEMLMAQDGWPMLIPAAAFLMLAAVGLGVYWKQGLRSVTVAVVLYLGGLAWMLTPEIGMRLRYLVPIQPLLLVAAFKGTERLLQAFTPRLDQAGRRKLLLRTAAVFTGIVIAFNAPKIAREAFYYSTLSYTDGYYETLRGGDFVDHHPVAELLEKSCAEDERVGTFHFSVLHYLSRCTTASLPMGDDPKQPDAAAVMAFLNDHPDVAFVVLDTPCDREQDRDKPWERFTRDLIEKLRNAGAKSIYNGKRLLVFRRN